MRRRPAPSAARSRTSTRTTAFYDADLAAERVAAAVEAARALDFPFTLTARAENFLRGNPDLDDTIARLQAFEAAGADVLYAPRLRTTEQIEAVCAAVSKPVNVLGQLGGPSIAEIFAAGAQRISVGGWLGWVAYGAAYDGSERGGAGRHRRAAFGVPRG